MMRKLKEVMQEANQNQAQKRSVLTGQEIKIEEKEGHSWAPLTKIVSLMVLGLVFVLGSVYYFSSFLISIDIDDVIWGVVFGILFLIVISLMPFFFRGKGVIFTASIIYSFAPILLFVHLTWDADSILLFAGSFLFFVFLILGFVNAGRSMRNSLEIKFFRVSKAILSKTVTGFLIFLSVVVYMAYFNWGVFSDELGRKFSDVFVASAEPFVRVLVPNALEDGTVGGFISAIASAQLNKNEGLFLPDSEGGGQPGFLTPQEKAQAIEVITDGLKEKLEETVGPLDISESFSGAVYRVIKNNFSKFSSKLGADYVFGLVVAVLVFVFLRSFAVLFYWPIKIVGYGIYNFLLAVGFAHLVSESCFREDLTL